MYLKTVRLQEIHFTNKNCPGFVTRAVCILIPEGVAPSSKVKKVYPTDSTAIKAATQCVIQPATVNEWKISWNPNVLGLGSGHLKP
jgi:hypothetical protein